jgi:hypothetical protein
MNRVCPNVHHENITLWLAIEIYSLPVSSARGEDLKKNRPIRNKNCLWWPCLLMDRDKMSNLYREPSIDASYQVLEKIKM